MKKEIYDTLTEKEKIMYEEMANFSVRLTERMEEIIGLLKIAIGGDK